MTVAVSHVTHLALYFNRSLIHDSPDSPKDTQSKPILRTRTTEIDVYVNRPPHVTLLSSILQHSLTHMKIFVDIDDVHTGHNKTTRKTRRSYKHAAQVARLMTQWHSNATFFMACNTMYADVLCRSAGAGKKTTSNAKAEG